MEIPLDKSLILRQHSDGKSSEAIEGEILPNSLYPSPEAKPTFLYPFSNQFPFDRVCGNIVKELEKRNWKSPFAKVEFDEYGSGEQKFKMVRHINGLDYSLHFCRTQRTLPGGNWNDTAAVTDLAIPGKQLNVYEDESGPTFYYYVGNKWAKDAEKFLNSFKMNSKLNNEARYYIKYRGSWQLPNTQGSYIRYSGKRAPYLVYDNDFDREYNPKRNEPTYFNTAEVMDEFSSWLEQNVYTPISESPLPKDMDSFSTEPKLIPFPANIGPLFTLVDGNAAQRILIGQHNLQDLRPSERYGLIGNGYRLVSLESPNDGTIPEIAYEGFSWCVEGEYQNGRLIIDENRLSNCHGNILLQVTPFYANDIYIADIAGSDQFKTEVFRKNPLQRQLTNAEYNEYLRIPGRTITPVTEYQEVFQKPVILINRELSLAEVALVNYQKDKHLI